MKHDTRSQQLLADLIPPLLVATQLDAAQESSGSPKLIDATPVERQAADWVILIANPQCSKEQLRRLDRWLDRSEEHERVFTELNTIWCQTGRLHECPSSALGGPRSLHATDAPTPEVSDYRSALEKALSLRQRVLQHFVVLVRDRADAERLVQQTYRRLLLMERPHLAQIRSMGPYLLRLATHVAQEHVRKAEECKPLRPLSFPPACGGSSPEEDAGRAMRLLERLPKLEREALVSLRLYGYTASETAQRLGVTVGAVRKRVASAIEHLHDALLRMAPAIKLSGRQHYSESNVSHSRHGKDEI
jgi:DNA-directed RNA polymerase specialized sigma24 family protein